jgi:lipopolysaccharide transport system permease protein
MYSVNPVDILKGYWRNRSLAKRLVSIEILNRYQGTYLGSLWVIADPVIMLAVYTFVFRIIFHRHWYGGGESTIDFAIIVFAGLLVFNLFRDIINSAPRLIIRNANYVKKVVFPLELLSLVSVVSGLFHMLVGLLLLLALCLIANGHIQVETLYVPVIIFPFALILFGLSIFFASLGVYLRDLGQLIGLVVMITLFLSAIFYPIESVPEQYRFWFYVNPVAFTIEQFRAAVIWGRSPEWRWLLMYYPASLAVAWLGLFWFQKTRKGFADVL